MSVEAVKEAKTVSFKEYGKQAAATFLRTAILIDDDISASSAVNDAVTVKPPEFLVPKPFDEAAVSNSGEQLASDESANVSIKPLADAFLDHQIVCGVLKPAMTDDTQAIVKRAVRAALVADIVIIDWYLRTGNEDIALSILANILSSDRESKGRLRLIIVYTSAIPLTERREALVKHLADHHIQCEDIEDENLLQAGGCRIKFIQKRDGAKGMAVDALPVLAIEEFARLSGGLLSNFALRGIGALRDATHHMLSTFDRRIDPAFVGHRLLARKAESAHGLAMSLLMLQIRGLLSLPEHLGSSLSDDEIGSWFDERFDYVEAEAQLIDAGTSKDQLRRHLFGNDDLPGKCKKLHSALFAPDAHRMGAVRTRVDDSVSKDFARLATFVREFDGFNPLPTGWCPTLTLGSVVKATIGGKVRYLLCVQPACDTVRINLDRYFPFIDLIADKVDGKSENLAIKDKGTVLVVRVNSKAGARHYEEFSPDGQTLSVRAKPKEKAGKILGYFFKGRRRGYEWLGDIDAMKAQRIAVDLSGTLARVGIDEYEWLRKGGLVGK